MRRLHKENFAVYDTSRQDGHFAFGNFASKNAMAALAALPHDRPFHAPYVPFAAVDPFLAALAAAFPGCGARTKCERKHPVPGIPGQPPRRRGRSVCPSCLDHTLVLLGLGITGPIPGIPPPADLHRQFLHGGPSSRAQFTNPPPPRNGFLTPLCPECEDDALSLAFWQGGNALFPGTTAPPAGMPFLVQPPAFTDTRYRYPMSTCTCLHTAGILPPPPLGGVTSFAQPALTRSRALNEEMCLHHRHAELEKLWQRRDENEAWLKGIMGDPKTGQAKRVTQAALNTRQNLNGTDIACRCGRDWIDPAGAATPGGIVGGLPPALLCMGCEGYVIDFAGPCVVMQVSAGGIPQLRNWDWNRRVIGDRLMTAAGNNWAPIPPGQIRWEKYRLRRKVAP
ncbi:hypothetical protein HII31_09843 [Pseudocercospora fuligena]|uniref:Uncharacterized protein n=1 Tax=Pseudocercospora fuligena TaxID=685502 RepID=A0A8H6VF00_9PEZI|nr:hypothetical protein HII31_09843 [Pseudocercospora fuligena]